MLEHPKLAAILAADTARLPVPRLRGCALRSDLIDPTIALHHGRIVKRTGDSILIEFRSVVEAVRCAIIALVYCEGETRREMRKLMLVPPI
jgi:adenylate cyclase